MRRLGRFELIEQVGVGSFGSVWKACDTQLDRTVAVKIPRAGQLDGHETELFLREARAAAQLKHPNIFALAFSPDAQWMAVSGQSNRVSIYQTGTWRKVAELTVTGLLTSGLVFSPDNRTLITASPCGDVKFWQVASWQEVGTLRLNEHVRRLAFLDEDTLVTASMESFVRLLRAAPLGKR